MSGLSPIRDAGSAAISRVQSELKGVQRAAGDLAVKLQNSILNLRPNCTTTASAVLERTTTAHANILMKALTVVSAKTSPHLEALQSGVKSAANTIKQKLTADKISDPSKNIRPTILVPREDNTYTRVAQGKSKQVFIDMHKGGNATDAYYKPVKDLSEKILNGRTKEILEEVVTTKKIKDSLNLPDGKESNLALKMEVVEGQRGLLVKTDRAAGDLEKLTSSSNSQTQLSGEQKKALVGQIINGMQNLHKANFLHGDIKLENVLYAKNPDGTLTARISDFGKTRRVDGNERQIHTGNPRYACPEGGVSKAGEVYSTGIMLIRVLESGLPHGADGMLIPPEHPDAKAQEAANKRYGIEKFLLLNENCTQTDNSTMSGNITILGREMKAAAKLPFDGAKQDKELSQYIDVLTAKLQEGTPPSFTAEEARKLNTLLKTMTTGNPDLRLTMNQAAVMYAS